jgi:predicted GIY-YIG superfamily endonuclease
MFWVYILRNPQGQFYIGHTDNLDARIRSHNRTDKICNKFTRKNGPWVLAWSEAHANRSGAMRRERQIKNWKSATLIRDRLLYRVAQW